MIKETMIAMNSEVMGISKSLESGRNRAMSLLNLDLNISCFDINIKIKRNEEKHTEKMRKIIENDIRINEALERRNNLEYHYMMYHIAKHE